SRPVITLNNVVLPAPLGPMRPVTKPGAADSDTESRATLPPKRTMTSRTSSAGRSFAAVSRSADTASDDTVELRVGDCEPAVEVGRVRGEPRLGDADPFERDRVHLRWGVRA